MYVWPSSVSTVEQAVDLLARAWAVTDASPQLVPSSWTLTLPSGPRASVTFPTWPAVPQVPDLVSGSLPAWLGVAVDGSEGLARSHAGLDARVWPAEASLSPSPVGSPIQQQAERPICVVQGPGVARTPRGTYELVQAVLTARETASVVEAYAGTQPARDAGRLRSEGAEIRAWADSLATGIGYTVDPWLSWLHVNVDPSDTRPGAAPTRIPVTLR